jgi:hypothetical protein
MEMAWYVESRSRGLVGGVLLVVLGWGKVVLGGVVLGTEEIPPVVFLELFLGVIVFCGILCTGGHMAGVHHQERKLQTNQPLIQLLSVGT